MKLQQLRYIVEVVNHNLNVSLTAESLYTSQPGVSKQIKLLEDELGIQIFTRNGKHFTQLTPIGEQIVALAREVIAKTKAIKAISAEHASPAEGVFNLATTYSQAKYELPSIIQRFMADHPDISFHMNQYSPKQIVEGLTHGQVDLAIVSENLPDYETFIVLPCYHWNRAIVVTKTHPLAKRQRITLDELVEHPLVTYNFSANDESLLSSVFKRTTREPNIVFSAMDADVIKTYVRLGIGVGVIAKMAIDPNVDDDLVVLNAGNIFPYSTTSLIFQRSLYLRNYIYDFISYFSPHLTREIVNKAANCTSNDEVNAMFNGIKLPVK